MEKETKNSHKVLLFEKKEICNNGTARYQLDLALAEKYPVTKERQLLCVAYPKSTIKELTSNSSTTGERAVSGQRF